MHAVSDDGELVALQVTQDGAIALVDVDDVEVEPVGLLVVGVTGGVAEVDLILAVALVLGVGACAGALHDLLGAEVELTVVAGIRHRQAGNRRMPVDAAPAEIDVVGVIAQDEGRWVGCVIFCCQIFLLAKRSDVTGFLRDAVPDLGLVGVAGVENHHAFVGQHHKGRVVVVVGLEVAADEHVGLALGYPVVLRSLHVAVDINITEVGGVDVACLILIVQCARVSEPTPGSFFGDNSSAVTLLCSCRHGGSDCHAKCKK